MKKNLLFYVWMLLLTACEQDPSQDSKTIIDYSKDESGQSITRTHDGGFVIGGYTNSILGNTDFLILKMHDGGQAEWSKTFGGEGIDRCYRVIATRDGGYAAVGVMRINNIHNDMVVVKVNHRGELLWMRNFGGVGQDEGRSLVEAPDGSLYVCGLTDSFGAGGGDVFLVRLSEGGVLKWQQTYGGNFLDQAFDIIMTQSGNLLIVGRFSDGIVTFQGMMMEVSAAGNFLWTLSLGLNQSELSSVVEIAPGEFIAVGRVSVGFGNYASMAVRFNQFDTVYTRTFGIGTANSAIFTDGQIVFTGVSIPGGATVEQLTVCGINLDGGILWQQNFGGNYPDRGNDVIKQGDQYIAVGSTIRQLSSGNDLFIVRVNP